MGRWPYTDLGTNNRNTLGSLRLRIEQSSLLWHVGIINDRSTKWGDEIRHIRHRNTAFWLKVNVSFEDNLVTGILNAARTTIPWKKIAPFLGQLYQKGSPPMRLKESRSRLQDEAWLQNCELHSNFKYLVVAATK